MPGILENAPITRTILFSAVALMILAQMKIVDPIDLFYDFDLIKENKQYYRFLTSILYFGSLDINTIMRIYGFVNFASLVESALFCGKPANYMMFLLFTATLSFISAAFTNEIFFGSTLASVCFYYFSKHFSKQSIQLLGFPIAVPASVVPYIYVVLAYVRGGARAMIPDVLGIVIGHLYYYIHDVLAIRFGTSYLEAPQFMERACKALLSF